MTLQASPTTTVVVYRGGQALARVGVVGESPVVQDAPILQRCIREGKYGRELYLPALQVCVRIVQLSLFSVLRAGIFTSFTFGII